MPRGVLLNHMSAKKKKKVGVLSFYLAAQLDAQVGLRGGSW